MGDADDAPKASEATTDGLDVLDALRVRDAPLSIIIAADFSRNTSVYGARGIRYVRLHGGRAQLPKHMLGLGAVAASYDDEVKRVLGIRHDPLYIMPVVWPRKLMREARHQPV